MVQLQGVVPVIPIPFDPDENIDTSSLSRTLDWIDQYSFSAMCLPAYGSEFYKLTEAEREAVVAAAINHPQRKTPVIAQANHGSSKIAAKLANHYEQMGADMISFAIPRQFASTTNDLMHYCGRICDAVTVPILIQDFNPGGPTIDADFIDQLSKQHANFKYAKLEEPLIVEKLKRITDCVNDRVGILEGWGGYYMLEAIPVGAVGIMPGVPLAAHLQRVFNAKKSGHDAEAYDLFASALPFINFTLQDFELFLQTEKRLMVQLGLFKYATLRSLTYSISKELEEHISFLINQILRVTK